MVIVDQQIDKCVVLQVTWFVKYFHYMNIQNDNDEWKNERTTRNVSMLMLKSRS